MTSRWEVERALRDSALPSPARLVALVLLTRAESGTPRLPAQYAPSLTQLAHDTGLGRSTVTRALNTLESAGWIIRTRDLARSMAEKLPTGYELRIPSPGAGLVPEKDQSRSGTSPADDRTLVPLTTATSTGTGHRPERSRITPEPAPQPDADRNAHRDAGRDLLYTRLPGFAEFWATYPLKKDKGTAVRAYQAALSRIPNHDPSLLIKAAAVYRDDPARSPKFTKYPSSWLNAESYLNGDSPDESTPIVREVNSWTP